MKLSAALALTFTLALTLTFNLSAATPAPDSCSCSAPDGSCSASASCPHGCTAICRNDGNCRAFCPGFYGYFETEVTLRTQNSTGKQLFDSLARISGKDVAFSPYQPNEVFNVDLKRTPLWNVLETLSESGKIQIAGEPFEQLKSFRKALVSGEKMTFCVQGAAVSVLINDLSNLSGLPLRITSGSPKATVNIKLQNVTLREMLVKVSEQTGTQIIEDNSYSALAQ